MDEIPTTEMERQDSKSDDLVGPDEIRIVEENISLNWKDLGQVMEISEEVLKSCELENQVGGYSAMAHELIIEWRRKNRHKATVAKLRATLSKIGREDICHKLTLHAQLRRKIGREKSSPELRASLTEQEILWKKKHNAAKTPERSPQEKNAFDQVWSILSKKPKE